MTLLPERSTLIEWIQEAVQNRATLANACAQAQIGLRTYRRWYQAGSVQADKRAEAIRPAPTNKLSGEEQAKILELCNMALYANLPPTQIVPALMDQGVYVASESSFYRVLKHNDQLNALIQSASGEQ